MKTVRSFQLVSAGVVLAFGGARALGDDNAPVRPLVQTRFDHLIPSSSPADPTDFGRLHHTTFGRLIPSNYPNVVPEFGRLTQTTFNRLVPSSFPAIKTKPAGPAN